MRHLQTAEQGTTASNAYVTGGPVEIASFWIGAVGTLLGVVGLILAVQQSLKVKRVESLRQGQLRVALSMVSNLITIGSNSDQSGPNDPAAEAQKLPVLALGHKDLYKTLVGHYLSGEAKFGSEKSIAAAISGLANGTWETSVWRQLAAEGDESPATGGRSRQAELDRLRIEASIGQENEKTPS